MSDTKDITSMDPQSLQSTVQSILGNPAFAGLIKELSSAQSAPEKESSPPPNPPQISPEMLAKLPQMMSAMAPLLSGKQESKKGEKATLDDAEKRKRLLAALRPYLSSQRKDAIDSILKVTEMTDLISRFGPDRSSAPKEEKE